MTDPHRPEALRICLVASSRFPIREPYVGGLEAHTATLAEALHRRGHAVSLFAAPGSRLGFPVVALDVPAYRPSRAARADVGAPPERWMQDHHAYLTLMMRLVQGGDQEFDVVLNNSLHHLPVAMAPALPVPTVTILHTPPVPWLESAIEVARPAGTFVAVSAAMTRAWAHSVGAVTILNGVDQSRWAQGPGGSEVVWSGRIAPEKAPHEAIDAARATRRSIVLAGPIMDEAYFDRSIRPRLGASVRYAGHLDQAALAVLVGGSRVALVTPTWEEPFGLVAAEAMSCGTPVAGYARGGLPEVVTERTGRLARSPDVPALSRALDEAALLDRDGVRRHALATQGLDRMTDRYERLLHDVVGGLAA